MIARLQQFITLAALALAAAWAVVFLQRGQPAVAIAGALLAVFGYALFLAVEFVLLARHGSDDSAPVPRKAQLLRAWAAEALHAPRVFCWRQPFRSRAEPDFLPTHSSARRGVVFVHGFVCNRGFWNPWMALLRARGVPFSAPNLEPPSGSIDGYVEMVDAAVRRVEQVTGRAPVIVAHSMGGLAVRAWLARTSDGTRVHRVVTIGTPHHGTWLARWSRTPNGHEMKRDSPWLRTLEASERPGDRNRFVCFFGHCDNIVFPTGTATLLGADNRHLEETAHVQMAGHPEIVDTVLGLLENELDPVDPQVAQKPPRDARHEHGPEQAAGENGPDRLPRSPGRAAAPRESTD
jgi:triacylglycerol esterase/lipase EstA (alpha/beta hydrolase family)